MPQQQVVIAFDPDSAERAQWWAAEIPRSWPRTDQRAACLLTPFDQLAECLRTREGLGRHCAIVLIADAGLHRPMLMQLVDRLLEARRPTLVLTDSPGPLRAELEPEGILVERLNCDAGTVARTLHALSARQPAMDSLSTELHVARASQSGLSGEIGRLHDELQLAGAVQRRFLPGQFPEMGGHEFGVFFRPCGYVSGDIYDVVRIDAGRVAFMLADAVGHGVPAALLTLVIGRALRHVEHTEDGLAGLGSPAATLARLNAELCIENEAGDRFATAICGVLDEDRGVTTLAIGGHPPPLVIDPSGSARRVTGGEGPLLGVFPHIEFPETTVELRPGQTLLLFSDGFETAFPHPDENPSRSAASEDYVRHFAEAVKSDRPGRGSVQRGLERLALDLDTQAGSLHQRDDLTALALRRLPETVPGVASLRAVA